MKAPARAVRRADGDFIINYIPLLPSSSPPSFPSSFRSRHRSVQYSQFNKEQMKTMDDDRDYEDDDDRENRDDVTTIGGGGEKNKKKMNRSRDVSIRFRANKTRGELRKFLMLVNYSLTHLVGISQKPNRWVDFTCTTIDMSMLLKQKARLSKDVEKVVGYIGEDEVKVSLMWVSSSVSDEEILEFMSRFGKIKTMMRLKDKDDGLENGSVLLVFQKQNFRVIPTYLGYGESKFLVRHEGQPGLLQEKF